MGTWGPGNFDGDEGYDVLGFWLQRIVAEIQQTFLLDTNSSLYDDRGEGFIIANIDILCTLCEHYNTRPDLTAEQIETWKADYLNTFDDIIHVYDPNPSYLLERRKAIEETFDRLDKLIRETGENM